MSEAAKLEGSSAPGFAGQWLLRNPALVVLGVAVVVSGAILIALGSHLILYGDDWRLVLDRRGFSAGSFLDPHQGHLVLSLVVIYKLVLATFGMSSPVPLRVVSTLIYLTAAVLLFAYARRRVGEWLALLGTLVILFFGASAVDMLSPFQVFFSGSIAAGLGALLALDRDDAPGDAMACALLVLSISFGEVGIPFTVGALVEVALNRRSVVSRLYVIALPLALYALWWLGWGHTGPSYFTLENVGATPRYVLDAVATAMGALLGITSSAEQQPEAVGQEWAPILLAAAAAAACWRVARLRRVSRGLWVVLAIGGAYWALAGLNQNAFRLPDNGRYLYPSAVFLLLIASELLEGVRLGTRELLAVAAVAAVSVAANLAFLSDAYRLFWKPTSETAHADLAALDIAGAENPSFNLKAGFLYVNAGSYLSAVEAWGSPGYSEEELVSSPERVRAEADRALGAILNLKLSPSVPAGGPCRTVNASPSGAPPFEIGPGQISFDSAEGTVAQASLGRYSDQLPIDAGSLRPGAPASLTIPPDRSDRPWRLGLRGHGPVTVCGRGVT